MKTIIVLLFSITFSLNAFSESIENPLLWKAEKDGNTAYLFGTFHLGFGVDDLPVGFTDYVNESEYFFMETDLSSEDQAAVLQRATYPEGQSLDMFLPVESWNSLVNQFSFMQEEQLKTFKPWFVLNSLAAQVAMTQLDFSGSLDTELLSYAREQNKEIGFLETASLQFSVLEATTSVSTLHEALSTSGSLIEDSKNQLTEIFECYQVSDVTCIERLLGVKEKGGTLYQWQYDLLLKQRNITWIPIIERSVERGTTFVAVGAGHLVGEYNVLDLLREQGFSISPVY